MSAWFKRNRQLVLRGSGTVLGLVLLLLLLRSSQNSWAEIQTAIRRLSLAQLILSFGLILFSRLCITGRWWVLLRAAGVKMPFSQALSLVFTGLFANNFLPTTIGGDVVRLAGAMQLGYDRAICLASIAVDRIVNMIGMSLASPLGFWQLIPAAAPLGQSLALAGIAHKGLDFLRRTLSSFSLWLKQPSALLLALSLALLHMLASFSANYVLINGLGAELALWRVIGLFSLVYFVSLLPISINGYGVHELTVTFILSQFGGVSLPVSASVAVLYRLFMLLASLPGALTLPAVLAGMQPSQKP